MINKEVLEDVKNSIFNPNNPPAIQTGFFDLDLMLKDAKASSLIVIGARPAMGKTSLTMNIMLNLLQNKKKCLLFSLEMSQEMLIKRLIAQDSEIDCQIIHNPEMLQEKHKTKIQTALDNISKYDLTIDDSTFVSTEKIREKIETEKPEYVFIDYLQLIHTSDKKSKADGLTQVVHELKQIAKDNNCRMFITSQLSRAVESRNDKRPMLSDLRGCGSIEDIADVVLFIFREEYYRRLSKDEEWLRNRAEIIVAKNKSGPIGITHLLFKASVTKFYNPIKTDVF